MKAYQLATLAMAAGIALGAAATEGLRAQASPPAYFIAMHDVHDWDNFLKEYGDKSAAYVASRGAHIIARGGKVVALQGEPPKARVVIQQWDSMDQLMAWWNSPQNAELQKAAAKYATLHAFAVEGQPR
jgi:uncharacterized protein (DUF1330 family)